MDRNSILGFGLLAALFLVFGYINKPTEEQIAAQKKKLEQQQEAEKVEKQKEEKQIELNQAKAIVAQQTADSNFVEETYTLENKELKLQFSNKGGAIQYAELKNYKTYHKEKLILFNQNEILQTLQVVINDNTINTIDLNFVKDEQQSSENELVLRSPIGEGFIEFYYNLASDYKLDFDINFINLDASISRSSSYMEFVWNQNIVATEKGKEWENRYTELSYKYFQDEVDELSANASETKELKSRLKWIAYKQQFFSTILVADNQFMSANIESEDVHKTSKKYLKNFKSNIELPFKKGTKSFGMSMYILPNKFNILEEQGAELKFNEFISLGWGVFGWVNEYIVIPLFNFLENYIANYGIIILILTLIIKTMIFPFTYKSYVSQAKMKALKPEIDKINEKIPAEKAMERQQETMKLYRKAGVNPLGGCLPMLFQMPFLYALFLFFPAAMELRGEAFLWAEDLSSYDSIFTLPWDIPFYGDHVSLFTLLMTVTNIFYTKINSQNMNTGGQMAGMKYMMYFMPIFFLFFLNNYASGLSYYYFISLLITIGQTLVIKATIDDKKILAKLQANKAKPKKKSRFQAALEEAQKKQNARNRR
jgi:YidC/Oxa1 family membrane protein insertase